MGRNPRADRGERPAQGAHLLQLRLTAGLTQTQLAEAVRVPQATIALWEWSSRPPRSEVLPAMAGALNVSVDALIAAKPVESGPSHRGPVGEVQRVFEDVKTLPRKQQRKIVETVTALIEQYRRTASQG